MRTITWLMVVVFSLSVSSVFAQTETPATAPAELAGEPDIAIASPEPASTEAPAATAPAPKFVIFLPEQIDTMWYWYYLTDESQAIAQSAVEKALLSKEIDVIDLAMAQAYQSGGTIEDVTNPAQALKKAMELGAQYAVIGQAQAVHNSPTVAYGVTVFRGTATARAKIIRVSDGKVMASVESEGQGGGQGAQMAAQEALKDCAEKLGKRVALAVKNLPTP
jgi:hypothetical protein